MTFPYYSARHALTGLAFPAAMVIVALHGTGKSRILNRTPINLPSEEAPMREGIREKFFLNYFLEEVKINSLFLSPSR